MVVLYHASNKVFLAPKYWGDHVFGGFFDFGHAGVEFFFVLSGFIVAYIHARDIGHPDRLGRYVRNRFVRVYPVYWIILVGFLALTTLGFSTSVTVTPSMISSAFLLIGPETQPTVLAVAWTLFHEIAFYAVFGVAIVMPRIGFAVVGVWLTGIAAAVAGRGFLPAYLGQPINLLFLLGVGSWWITTRWERSLPLAYAFIGAACILALGIENVFNPVFSQTGRQLLFGTASAMVIVALVAAERRQAIKIPAILSLLGAASYSMYLVHFPLLGMLARVHNVAFVRTLPIEVMFFALVTVAVLGGVAFHLWVELPVLAFAKRPYHLPRLTSEDPTIKLLVPELQSPLLVMGTISTD